MRRVSLFAAAAIVLVANGFALAHAWQNRTGPAYTDIVLTEREIPQAFDSAGDDSGITLNLFPTFGQPQSAWLDARKLRDLGFDTFATPSDPHANEFYERQRAKRVFVALELNGPAWAKWSDSLQQQAPDYLEAMPPAQSQLLRRTASRLFEIDADTDATRLRARHPDRSSVIIIPAVLRIVLESEYLPETRKNVPRLTGWIEDLPTSIHVPLAFSDGFRRLLKNDSQAKYNVHLRYGASFEPWVVGVEFMPSGPSPGLSPVPAIAPHDPPPSSAPR